jgi:hypothetical protein
MKRHLTETLEDLNEIYVILKCLYRFMKKRKPNLFSTT